MPAPAFTIQPVRTPDDLMAAATLFRLYAEALEIDLAYQGFEDELAGLPGKYAPPAGEILLARASSGQPLGCVAVRPLTEQVCEMKRLYVAPQARGMGLGKALVEAIIDLARKAGYREMRLDTLDTMAAAIGLYRSFGFVFTSAYYDTPVANTVFMALQLGR